MIFLGFKSSIMLVFLVMVVLFGFVLQAESKESQDAPEWLDCVARVVAKLPPDMQNNTEYYCCGQILRCHCLRTLCCGNGSSECTVTQAIQCETLSARCSYLTDKQFPIECKGFHPDDIAGKANCTTPTTKKPTVASTLPSSSTTTGGPASKIWIAFVAVIALIALIIVAGLIYYGTVMNRNAEPNSTSQASRAKQQQSDSKNISSESKAKEAKQTGTISSSST